MIHPMEAATFWLALDPADEHNGAVVYGVGSHRHGMRPHEPSGVLGFSQKVAGLAGERRVYLLDLIHVFVPAPSPR